MVVSPSAEHSPAMIVLNIWALPGKAEMRIKRRQTSVCITVYTVFRSEDVTGIGNLRHVRHLP